MKYFGTDGFRGEANVGLTTDHAYRIGRFIGWYYGQDGHRPRIVIGKDTRRSSYMFESALYSGLLTSGADAYLMHVTTTPSVSFITKSESFDCGIMVTASHNPFYDNGIKLVDKGGLKMPEEILEKVESYIDGEFEIPVAQHEEIGFMVDYSAGRNRYSGYLISLFSKSLSGYKVGLDCANGSAYFLAKNVFDALGAETYAINCLPDGLNVNRNCGSTHIEGLQRLVVEKNLDVGFAFDGDADRCLAVDEKGNVIDGDLIMFICAKFMNDRGYFKKQKVVTTVMSNLGLYKALDAEHIGYEKTAVGDKYVSQCMRDNNYFIGGEQSGHIIFREHAETGDGILTALKIMEVLLEAKSKLSYLASPMKIYPQLLKNVKVENKDKILNSDALKNAVSKVEAELGTNGRVLVRKSGTEPLIRVMVEAETEKLCQKYVDYIISEIS